MGLLRVLRLGPHQPIRALRASGLPLATRRAPFASIAGVGVEILVPSAMIPKIFPVMRDKSFMMKFFCFRRAARRVPTILGRMQP
jgi:hypothetical protein